MTQPASPYFWATAPRRRRLLDAGGLGLHLTVHEPDRIAALLPALRNSYFISDGGYLVGGHAFGLVGDRGIAMPAALARADVRKAASRCRARHGLAAARDVLRATLAVAAVSAVALCGAGCAKVTLNAASPRVTSVAVSAGSAGTNSRRR